jgi:hypothetical protein
VRLLIALLAVLVFVVCPLGASAANTPLPAQVYAPYYEAYLGSSTPSIPDTAQASGANYLTLAFLQSAGKGSCTLTWNGDRSQLIGKSMFDAGIATLQSRGGDVIPSFGGYSADKSGTEIADSCTNVQSIAADYESVIMTYHVKRLDMDVEAKSLDNTAGIDRRNKAIAVTEQWAAVNNIPLQIQYTLPVEPQGLEANGEAVLQNAVQNGARVDSVNIMVFDYYQRKAGTVNMGQAAMDAATNTYTELQSIFGSNASWAMEGMTLLPGIDDFPKKTEVTSLGDAQTMLNFAEGKRMNFLSIWAIQRDNGGCPGTTDSNTCSGITQNTWDFSHLLEPFTSP